MSDTPATAQKTGGYGVNYGVDYGANASTLTRPATTVAALDKSHLGNAYLGPLPPEGYTLEIETGGGERVVIEEFTSLSVTVNHTQLSSWSATVPTFPAIGEHVLSRVHLKWSGIHLFNGVLQDVSADINSPTTTIEGEGVGATLARGELRLDFRNTPFWRAIRDTWARTDFEATVIPPEDPGHPANQRIGINADADRDDGRYSGTPLSILKSLHEDCGMRFTILHNRPGKHVESYPAGSRRRRHSWDVFDGERDQSAKGYANRVVVTGALKPDGSGDHYHAVATDDAEIAAMRERGIGEDGSGVVTYPIEDDKIDTWEKAKAKAESTLADLVDKDTVGGSLDVAPTIATPGVEYYVEEFAATGTPLAYGAGSYGEGPYGHPQGQYATLNSIKYSIGRGQADCSLDLSRRDGFASTLAKVVSEQ